MSQILSVVDLFAGCGGLSLGLEEAGFTPIFVNELDDSARQTYLRNRDHKLGGQKFIDIPELHSSDANSIDARSIKYLLDVFKELPETRTIFPDFSSSRPSDTGLDLLVGGPPCQGFSGIGIRRTHAVDRKDIPSNSLYMKMVEIIGFLRPKIFLFENVRGILNAKWAAGSNEPVFDDVLRAFRSLPNYEVRWSLIYSKHYEVPQNRPRVIIVGIRKDVLELSSYADHLIDPEDAIKSGFLPGPTHAQPPDLEDLLSDLIDPSIQEMLVSGRYPQGCFATSTYPNEPLNSLQKSLRTKRDGTCLSPNELTDHEYSKHSKAVVGKFTMMIENEGHVPEHMRTKKFSQRLLKRRWGNGSPNITATSLPDDYVHFAQPRTLSVREWARLQTFPDWYQFSGKRTTGGLRRAGNPKAGNFEREVPKYTQIGNAVPVALARQIGQHFIRVLSGSGGH